MKSIIFGIGMFYEKYKTYINDEIVGYIDNNNVGKKMPDGKKVISINEIKSLQFDRIIISSTKFAKEMINQLKEIDVDLLEKTILINEIEKTDFFVSKYKKEIVNNINKKRALSYKKCYIVSPCDFTSGGPELLHQLAFSLKKEKIAVYIAYYGERKNKTITPIEYSKYVSDNVIYIDEIEDVKENLVIIPEVRTDLIEKINNAGIYLWWLSVDFFFKTVNLESISTIFKKVELHLYQSEYAKSFLMDIGVNENMLFYLGDYLNEDYLNNKYLKNKEDIIVYNPKKGINKTLLLKELLIGYSLIPIENMSRDEVKNLLQKSKVYIDFGNHPGKDRLPREAAMMGCCIICGMEGAAGNEVDVPIDDKYKISEKEKNWANKACKIIKECIKNYDENNKNFKNYREKIKKEKDAFEFQVKMLVERLKS